MNPVYDIRDPRFRTLVLPHARLMQLSAGHLWTEGPVWFPAHQCLYFSDIPNNRMHRWVPDGQVTVFRDRSAFANGNTRDGAGRLVTCEHQSRSLTRTEADGTRTTLADRLNGKRLNSPNDVVVKADGSIWFTDPTYGIMSAFEGGEAEAEQPARNVFCLDPDTRSLTAVCDDFVQPNGLAFSTDERWLYIAESGASHVEGTPTVLRRFPVRPGNTLGPGEVFAEVTPGLPDGLRVDRHDNVWVSSAEGVVCFAPDGTLLGRILVPEVVSNLCFGGPRDTLLFITATTSLYAIHVNTRAARA